MIADAPPAFECPAPAFHDGDNIRCAGGKAMRLAGIDAPEFEGSRKCGRRGVTCDNVAAGRSRDHLRSLAKQGPVRCRIVDASPRMAGFQRADRYGRPIVRCRVGGVDLGEAQVRAGMARRW